MSAAGEVGLIIFVLASGFAIWVLVTRAFRAECRISALERQIREINPGLPPVEGA